MPDKIEIIKQVRLTPKQRLTLMDMANEGGSKPQIDHDAATVLLHLGLIKKAPRFTPAEKKARAKKRHLAFLDCITLARARDSKGLRRKVEDIESEAYHDNDQAYYLTPAASGYLANGTVTIKIGPAKKAAPDAE